MKFLIVASGFTGATLPLGNALARRGFEVAFFNFVNYDANALESLEFDHPLGIPLGKPVRIVKENLIYNYLDKRIPFYLLPQWKRKLRLEKVFIGKVFPWMNRILVKKYVHYILAERPDYVNMVIHTQLDVEVAKALYKEKVPFCMAFHEVLIGHDVKKLMPEVKEALNINMPIVLHSDNTARNLINAYGDKAISNRIHIINFGAFESFLSYGEGIVPNGLPEKYILYLGHIHPYKGLRYLFEAVKLIDDNLGDLMVVVAGGGMDKTIELMNKHPRFMVMNHFIANAELVGLIRNCQSIVCPYITASQSGLVQTSMVFKKPIIATRVGAFEEIVHEGVNGFLCEPANAQSLADALLRFLNDANELEASSVPEKLNWDLIADKYIKLSECNTRIKTYEP